jgi:cell division protein FtsB
VNDSDFTAYENHRLTGANAELRKERDELKQRIKQLEEERDAMMADLLLWRETVEDKP